MSNITFNGVDIPMAEYVLSIKDFDKYLLRLHVGYKTKVNKRYEVILNAETFGSIVKI